MPFFYWYFSNLSVWSRMPIVFIRNYLIFSAIMLSCALALGYVLVSGDRKIAESDSWITRTHETIIASQELSGLVSSMLASQRGYLISSEESFLNQYENQKAQVSRHLAELSELTADSPSQESRLQELREYYVKFSEHLENSTNKKEANNTLIKLEDVNVIDKIRTDISRVNDDFVAEEYASLDAQVRIVEDKKNQYLFTLLIGGGTALILIMIFNAYLLRAQSKRSAAETALNEREEVFLLAVEATQDGIFDWNIKTNEVFYSQQFMEMLGYKAGDFNGHLDDSVSKLHPDEKDQVMEYLDLYLNGQLSEYSNTFRMQHKSGRWIWVNARAKLVNDSNGKPIRLIGSQTDISASKEYELRLQEAKTKAEEANRAKTDFLAHMSHEIRTPLTTISGAAEILQQSKEGLDDKKQKLISVLSASSTTLKDLISDILDFSKIESGELELEEVSFDLEESFQHIVSIMSVRANEKKLDFVFDYEDVKGTHLYNDPIRLRQILINLIGNALKFTDEGHIHVKASKQELDAGDVLRIDVEDTGIGLAKDQFGLVFERFKQADASVSRKYGGTGLGLPISLKLATLMGGTIKLESKKGKGSTFSLIIPFTEVEGTQEDHDQNEARKNKINDKLKAAISAKDKVLLVEDYEGNIVVLSYILEEMDMEFDVARTGLEALNLWRENHYDLLLMDIQMPEMDGFTSTAQIRKIEEEQDLDRTPIIGMTAHALVGDKDKCIAAGMDAYLPKPINENDLKKTMLRFLRLRGNVS